MHVYPDVLPLAHATGRSTRFPSPESGARPTVVCSPWSSPFPPPTPPMCFLHVLVRRPHRYYGLVRLPLRVRAGRSVCSLLRPARPSLNGGHAGDLPVLVHEASAHAQGLRLRGVGTAARHNAAGRLAFPFSQQGRHPKPVISELNGWPAFPPVNASAASSRTPPHDSGPWPVATRYHVGLSHPLLHAGLSRRFLTVPHIPSPTYPTYTYGHRLSYVSYCSGLSMS